MHCEKVIAIVLHNRPGYTKQVLDALEKCWGIEDYRTLIHIDPGDKLDEIVQIARTSSLPNKIITIHKKHVGLLENVYTSLAHGFTMSDYVVYFEDDTLPCVDCLKLFEHCTRYGGESNIFSISAYFRSVPLPDKYLYELRRRSWFCCWGFATWRDRWLMMKKYWPYVGTVCWDACFNEVIRDLKYQEIFPMVSRVQNIGAESGASVPDSDWHLNNHYNSVWAGTRSLDPEAKFHEINREYMPPWHNPVPSLAMVAG